MSALQLERTLDFTIARQFAQWQLFKFEDMGNLKSEEEAREARYSKCGSKKDRGRMRGPAADDSTGTPLASDDDGAAGDHGKRSGTAAT